MDYPYKNEDEKLENENFRESIKELAKTLREEGNGSIKSDIFGSYTGMTDDNGMPVQDADDL